LLVYFYTLDASKENGAKGAGKKKSAGEPVQVVRLWSMGPGRCRCFWGSGRI